MVVVVALATVINMTLIPVMKMMMTIIIVALIVVVMAIVVNVTLCARYCTAIQEK